MTPKVYPCKLCGRVLKQQTHLKDHMATHSDVRNYQCSICASSFKTRGAMRFHFRKRHTLQQFYACIHAIEGKTTKKAPKKPAVRQLTIPQAMKPKTGTSSRPTKCTECDFVIKHRRNVSKHMLRHRKRNLKCPHKTCGMGFVWSGALRLHFEKVHGEGTAQPPQGDLKVEEPKEEGQEKRGTRRASSRVTRRSYVEKEEDDEEEEEEEEDESKSSTNLRISSCFSLTSEDSSRILNDSDVKEGPGVGEKVKQGKSYRYECAECNIGFDDNDELWKHLFDKHLSKDKPKEDPKIKPTVPRKFRRTKK